ncbi:MAG: hypothetical protein NVS1B14_01470 [Vulcanimicrobiaceae bacterium]
MKFWLAVIVAGCLCAAVPALADQNTGIIRGHVYVARSNVPVCGVRVFAESDNESTDTTLTDGAGFFVFIARFPGTVRVYLHDPNPQAERFVSVHPNFFAEPVLYASRQIRTQSANCETRFRRASGRGAPF